MAKWIKVKDVYVNENYIVTVKIGTNDRVELKLSKDAPTTGVEGSHAVADVPELVDYLRRQPDESMRNIPLA